MQAWVSEILGTCVLIALGNGVVANVLLNKTKGQGSGWIVISFGWAIAVFAGVMIAAPHSGAHLNPAVTLALASLGKFDWALVPAYILAQFLGAMAGSLLVWLAYRQHFDATEDPGIVLAVFSNAPAIRQTTANLTTEIIATFLFTTGVLYIVSPASSLGALDALPVALLVLGIGLCMGGPTGYAINPARDLGPRIMHALLPIKTKGGNDWSYSWIPVVGPVIGALLAAGLFHWLNS